MKRRNLLVAGAALAAAAGGAVAGLYATTPRPSPSPSPLASRAIRRLNALGDVVQEYGSIGGPIAWSPDGSRFCIEQVNRSGIHTVALVSTQNWTLVSEVPASRPVWAPDGSVIAAVRPFAPSIPPPPETMVTLLDGLTGNERESFAVQATSLGWARGELHALVAGRLVLARSPEVTKASCPGGCELAYWSPMGDLVAIASGGERAEFVLKRLTQAANGQDHESLGEARSLTWAPSTPALAWSASEEITALIAGRGRLPVGALPAYRPVAWSPHAEVLICGRAGANWKQWHAATGQVENLTLPSDLGPSSLLSWSPGGTFIAGVPLALSSARLRIYRAVTEAD